MSIRKASIVLILLLVTACSGFIMDGLRKEYYPNGKLQSEINYRQAIREGMCRLYYENGRLKEEGSYRNGQPEGTWKKYYESGTLKSEETYMQGNLIDTKTYRE